MSNAATNLSNIRAVPSLDQIASDAACLEGLPTHTLHALALKAASVQSAIAAAALVAGEPRVAGAHTERQLNADEIATALGVNRRWVFRHLGQLPFIRRVSPKSLVASESALHRWRETQKA